MTPKQKLLCSLLAFTAGSFVQAQDYILPVEAFASTTLQSEDNTIRNFGNKWGAGQTPDLSTGLNGLNQGWISTAGDLSGDGEAWISYDLGGQYNLSGANLVNATHQSIATISQRGIRTFDIQTSNDNATWSNVLTGQTLNQAATGNSPNQNFTFSTVNDVRYVRIRATQNWGDVNYVALTNASFQGTAAANQSYVDMTTVTASTNMGETFAVSGTVGNANIRVPANAAGSTANDAGVNNWVSVSGTLTGHVDFLLSENTDIQSLLLYNGNDGANAFRGVNQFDILVSSTDSGEDFVATTITDAILGITSNSATWVPGENWLLDENNVRRIRLNIDSNYGDPTYTMFNGLQIIAVPEPQAFALLGGLLALGFTALRRRR